MEQLPALERQVEQAHEQRKARILFLRQAGGDVKLVLQELNEGGDTALRIRGGKRRLLRKDRRQDLVRHRPEDGFRGAGAEEEDRSSHLPERCISRITRSAAGRR